MNKFSVILLVAAATALSGCLQTRADLRKDGDSSTKSVPFASGNVTQTPPPPPTKAQKEAMVDSRFDDFNKDFRDLNGRVEMVENQLNQVKDSEKVKLLEAKLAQMETKMGLLEASVAEMNAKTKKEAVAAAEKKEDLTEANKLFEAKKWEDAILAFEEYRKANPKNKNYPEVTYKIAVCFQNLGMKDDAKAFYKELVDKFPTSKEAGLAKSRLKKI